MDIKKFSPTPEAIKVFAGNDQGLLRYLVTPKNPCFDSELWLKEGFRAAISIHPDIRDEQGIPYGQIGLFMGPADEAGYKSFISDACTSLKIKGARKVLFPFYYTTWHAYRFEVLDAGNDFTFFLDQRNPAHLPAMAKKLFHPEIHRYKSSRVDDISAVVKKYDKSQKAIEAAGIRLISVRDMSDKNWMRALYDLSVQGFRDNLFYADLSFEEFQSLYQPVLPIMDPDFFTFAMEGDTPVGFLFSLPYYPSLAKRSETQGLILKSAAVLKSHSARGIYGALVGLHALRALQRNYKYLIYAFYYEDNYSGRAVISAQKEKWYELYEWAL